VVVKRNAGDGHVQGISTHVHLDIDENWWVYGSFSWTDGQIETFPTSLPAIRTESLSRLAPIQGILGAGWRSRDGSVRIRAEAIIVDAQDRLSTRDKADTQRIPPGGTPGYTIFNLHAEWSITENARLFASFENLGDKNYRTHGSGVQEPGFNAVMGVDINF
jgi:hemoglobin/transferrin/lactoferrin receptor protein